MEGSFLDGGNSWFLAKFLSSLCPLWQGSLVLTQVPLLPLLPGQLPGLHVQDPIHLGQLGQGGRGRSEWNRNDHFYKWSVTRPI